MRPYMEISRRSYRRLAFAGVELTARAMTQSIRQTRQRRDNVGVEASVMKSISQGVRRVAHTLLYIL
ncbi:hypothetical protein BON30_09675 [Cystobacter ferrugineus]|uniref:Uncharacterized protein n=1 Tax=Cystobacter ferrugineus TaxID=83449 RepID=A0A1L9BG14_9BACT|nr:hypothetical protein BON30_09675 [Cystobacter ferrugineus]